MSWLNLPSVAVVHHEPCGTVATNGHKMPELRTRTGPPDGRHQVELLCVRAKAYRVAKPHPLPRYDGVGQIEDNDRRGLGDSIRDRRWTSAAVTRAVVGSNGIVTTKCHIYALLQLLGLGRGDGEYCGGIGFIADVPTLAVVARHDGSNRTMRAEVVPLP